MTVIEKSDFASWKRPSENFHAHFDCFSGAAGDMLLASCLDSCENGDEQQRLLDHVQYCLKKGMPELETEFNIKVERVWKGMGSIAGLKVSVDSKFEHAPAPVPSNRPIEDSHSHSHEHGHGHKHDHEHEYKHENGHDHVHSHDPDHHHKHSHSQNDEAMNDTSHSHSHNHELETSHSHSHSHGHAHSHNHGEGDSKKLRNLPEIQRLLEEASDEYIDPWVRSNAIAAFTELAKAEAHTHGVESVESVHFHEVGAIDSIVDTVGTLVALHAMGVKSVSCSRLPIGEGMVWTDHGLLPVPAPATLRLLIDMPICKGPPGTTGELVTPTGAALLRALTLPSIKQNDNIPGRPPDNFVIRRVGIGAGTKEFSKHPNILRVFIGNISA